MRTVELRHAYAWTCEDCGRDNYHNGIVIDWDDEAQQQLRDEHGIQSWEEGEWHMIPEEVACQHCGATFATRDHREDCDDEK